MVENIMFYCQKWRRRCTLIFIVRREGFSNLHGGVSGDGGGDVGGGDRNNKTFATSDSSRLREKPPPACFAPAWFVTTRGTREKPADCRAVRSLLIRQASRDAYHVAAHRRKNSISDQ